MVGCIIGEVVSISKPKVIIEDRLTKQQYTCIPEGDLLLDLEVGATGVFVGQLYEGVLRIKRIALRQFLDPLAEDDLNEASGMYSFVPVINDPFTQTYLDYLEKQENYDFTSSEE